MGVAAWHSCPCLGHCWRLTASEQAAGTWAQQSHKPMLRRSEAYTAIKLYSAPQQRVLSRADDCKLSRAAVMAA